MIFDADTHLSPYRNFELSIDAAEWSDIIDRAGIDKALAWLLPQKVNDVAESNRYLYESAKRYPKMVPFGWANIGEGKEKALRDAIICLEEYGFSGVKLNGAQNSYFIDSLEAMEVCEAIAKRGGIIAFHIGADAPDHTSPWRAAASAKAFPKTPILMIHMGGALEPDVSETVIEAAREHSNMMLVGSAIGVDKVKNAIDALGASRVMFGSDTPFFDAIDHLSNYHSMLKPYSEEDARLVLGGNAQRIFGV